jgi:prephenate dehydrogenase
MDMPDFLSPARVAIVGLGLMGGSLAMALRGRCAALLGVDPDPQVTALALAQGIVDQASQDPGTLLPQANLIVLAAPVCAIIDLLAQLPDLHPGSPVVLDLGSTKRRVVEAMQTMPQRFDALGGHPMCGREQASLKYAEAGLYQNAPFALVRLPRTSPAACRLAEQLVHATGARPLWLDADTHDRWVAATSHLPYLVANALAAATPLEARPLVGPGLRSTTRLAGSSLPMMEDILTTNCDQVLAALARFRQALDEIEQALSCDEQAGSPDPRLAEALARGREQYHAIIS